MFPCWMGSLLDGSYQVLNPISFYENIANESLGACTAWLHFSLKYRYVIQKLQSQTSSAYTMKYNYTHIYMCIHICKYIYTYIQPKLYKASFSCVTLALGYNPTMPGQHTLHKCINSIKTHFHLIMIISTFQLDILLCSKNKNSNVSKLIFYYIFLSFYPREQVPATVSNYFM